MAFIEFGDVKFLWIGIVLIISLLLVYYFKFKKRNLTQKNFQQPRFYKKQLGRKLSKKI